MGDPEPQTAAGKVLFHFLMSLDSFVAGPGHTMDFMDRTTVREGLLQEYIDTTGGHPRGARRLRQSTTRPVANPSTSSATVTIPPSPSTSASGQSPQPQGD